MNTRPGVCMFGYVLSEQEAFDFVAKNSGAEYAAQYADEPVRLIRQCSDIEELDDFTGTISGLGFPDADKLECGMDYDGKTLYVLTVASPSLFHPAYVNKQAMVQQMKKLYG